MKDKDLVVAFGCLGAPIHIGSNKESRFNGNTQYTAMLKALLRCPSIKNVILMGAFGAETEKEQSWKQLDPEGKIIYPLPMVHKIAEHVWGKDAKFQSARAVKEGQEPEMIHYSLHRKFQDLYAQYCKEKLPQVDFGLFFISQGWCGTNIGFFVRKRTNPDEYRIQLPMAANKAGIYIHTINYLNFPWFIVSPDDRVVYSMPRHDTINMPKAVMGQWHAEYTWDVCTSYKDGVTLVPKQLVVDYGAVEKLNLIDATLTPPDTERPIKCSIVANQSTHRNDMTCQRFEQLKTWILDQPQGKDFNIYGEWSPAYLTGFKDGSSKEEHDALIEYNKKYLDYNDIPKESLLYPQFKGRVEASVIDEVFQKTRYTLCLPVIPGYLTWKYLEALMNGVLPFIPPFYDEQHNQIAPGSPLRVSSPENLYAKIEWFEAHPETRIGLVKAYQDQVLSYCKDGSFIYSHINRFLDKYNVGCQL